MRFTWKLLLAAWLLTPAICVQAQEAPGDSVTTAVKKHKKEKKSKKKEKEALPADSLKQTAPAVPEEQIPAPAPVQSQVVSQPSADEQKLRVRIEELEKMLDRHRRQLVFSDTCIARLANSCLYAPYNEKRVNDALSAFSRMYAPAYQQQMAPLRQRLSEYRSHYATLMGILREADADRALRNPFGGKEVAEKYIARIRQTDYYRNVYQAEWNIPYLNALIDKAIAQLKANNPGERQVANLKLLLEP